MGCVVCAKVTRKPNFLQIKPAEKTTYFLINLKTSLPKMVSTDTK
jgi:hypothetical protein